MSPILPSWCMCLPHFTILVYVPRVCMMPDSLLPSWCMCREYAWCQILFYRLHPHGSGQHNVACTRMLTTRWGMLASLCHHRTDQGLWSSHGVVVQLMHRAHQQLRVARVLLPRGWRQVPIVLCETMGVRRLCPEYIRNICTVLSTFFVL